MDFPGGAMVKNPPASAGNTGDADSIPGLGRCPGEGKGNLLQYSSLENSMHRGARWPSYRPCVCKETDMIEHAHTHNYLILAILVFRNSDSTQKGEFISASCGVGCRICDSLPHMFGVLTGCLK